MFRISMVKLYFFNLIRTQNISTFDDIHVHVHGMNIFVRLFFASFDVN